MAIFSTLVSCTGGLQTYMVSDYLYSYRLCLPFAWERSVVYAKTYTSIRNKTGDIILLHSMDFTLTIRCQHNLWYPANSKSQLPVTPICNNVNATLQFSKMMQKWRLFTSLYAWLWLCLKLNLVGYNHSAWSSSLDISAQVKESYTCHVLVRSQ